MSYLVVGIPMLLFLSRGMGLETVGIYYSFSVALIVASVLLYRAFSKAVAKMEKVR